MADAALSECLTSCAPTLTSTCVQQCLETAGYTIQASSSTGIPLAASLTVAPLLICFSALFSGLTLGLLSLDLVALQVLSSAGEPKEREYARRIMPIRRNGNLLLCTLLLGNTLVNNGVSILLADLTSGFLGLVTSTFLVLIFGEILPQALCSRHGLFVGAHTIWAVKFFRVLFFPIAFPLSWLLNKMLGRDIGNVYSQDEIKSLLELHATDPDAQAESGLTTSDHNLLLGALEYKDKRARDVMTGLEQCYMLEAGERLNFCSMLSIYKSGFTRIPVYRGRRQNIVGVLYAKDLILVDPDDEIAIETVLSFRGKHSGHIAEDTKLDRVLQQFLASGTHLMLVHKKVSSPGSSSTFGTTWAEYNRANNNNNNSSSVVIKMPDSSLSSSNAAGVSVPAVALQHSQPSNAASSDEGEVLGIITLEDVLEELLRAEEIVDESDVWEDVNARVPRSASRRAHIDIDAFLQMFERKVGRGGGLEAAEVAAVVAFLTMNSLIGAADVIQKEAVPSPDSPIKSASGSPRSPHHPSSSSPSPSPAPSSAFDPLASDTELRLYTQHEPSVYFTLILQGKVMVHTSVEGFSFDLGPWSVLGNRALSQDTYVPDFDAVAVPPCRLLRVNRAAYRAALRAASFSAVVGSRGGNGGGQQVAVQMQSTGSTAAAAFDGIEKGLKKRDK